MLNKWLMSLIVLVWINEAASQDLNLYERHWFIQNGDTLPYRILFPENYDTAKTYPLVLFLHGRGESGNDNQKQLTHGARLFLADSFRAKHPAIVVFPQCSAKSYWSNVQAVTTGTKDSKRTFYFVPDGDPSSSMKLAMSLLENLSVRYKIRRQQVYVMGLSMGGMGTFEIVRRKPDYFAAGIAICGGAHPATAVKINKTKWWVFHGAKDDVVLPAYSEKIVEALRKAKVSVKFTVYPEANHNSWDPAFAEPGLLDWLLTQRK
ncbi:MAG: prolyl oligopeptidase family serine peptidase [Chitinophagaceae bacterium]|nr:prolyl oligopeptidase family serine peptidase [Chitinophagaceae bacterium]